MTEIKENVPMFNIPSLALRLGLNLKILAHINHIKRCLSLRHKTQEMKEDAENFLQLMEGKWTDRVSSVALASIELSHFNNQPNLLPVTSDLVMDYMDVRMKQLTLGLSEKPRDHEWRELAEVVLVRIPGPRMIRTPTPCLASSWKPTPTWDSYM